MNADTIFALASGAGQAAIAVLRLSGPRSGAIVAALAGRLPAPRRATLCRLRDGAGHTLDRALVLWFPGPESYTGEDSAEVHLHGGRAVIDGVAAALAGLGARPAEAGEFTERAFVNGRLDLLEAEAIADLVAAETAAQRDQALRQMDGGLGDLYRGWSDRLLGQLARQEALIDFPDEDLPASVQGELDAGLAGLIGEMRAHLADEARGERLREGLVFAIVGPPNAGKSTLINALAGRDVAIVAATAGTTRDVIEARTVMGGVPVTLLDTAGLRDTGDPVEAEGVRRARDRAARADHVIVVTDAGGPAESLAGLPADATRVLNKADLLGEPPPGAVSALTGFGMDALRRALDGIARDLTQAAGPPVLTRARHRAEVTAALAALEAARTATLPELRGEDLRRAMHHLGRLTGAVGVEDVLDSVFRQFCIGK